MQQPHQICNPELDTEYMCSKVLSGLDYPSSYIDLRNYLSYIKVVDSKSELNLMYQQLIDRIVDDSGLLGDGEILKLWKGKDAKTFAILIEMQTMTEAAILEHDIKIYQAYREVEKQIESTVYSDYQGMANSVTSATPISNYMNYLDKIKQDLKRNSTVISHSIELYGSGKDMGELPTKKIKAEYSTDYAIFCTYLLNNMTDLIHNMDLARVLGTTITTAQALYPKDELDPYKIDQFNNLCYLLTNPKKLKSECRNDEVVSDAVGQAFFMCYPEFSQWFADSYMEKYDKMSYQDKLVFDRCIGSNSTDPGLTQFCVIHQQSQPQGGM